MICIALAMRCRLQIARNKLHPTLRGEPEPTSTKRLSMDTWLREDYGREFYWLGFAFDHGTIRAFRPQHGLGTQTVPAAPIRSKRCCAKTVRSCSLICAIYRRILLDWLNGNVWQREIGAVWDLVYADNYNNALKNASARGTPLRSTRLMQELAAVTSHDDVSDGNISPAEFERRLNQAAKYPNQKLSTKGGPASSNQFGKFEHYL